MLTLPLTPARQALATAVLAILVAAAPACAGPSLAAFGGNDENTQGRFEKTLNVSAPVEVNVSTGSGSIEIKPGSDNSVHVVGLIHVGSRWARSDSSVMTRVHEIEQNPPIE